MGLLSKFRNYLREIYNPIKEEDYDYNGSLLFYTHIDNYGICTIKLETDDNDNAVYRVYDEDNMFLCTIPFETDLNNEKELVNTILEKIG